MRVPKTFQRPNIGWNLHPFTLTAWLVELDPEESESCCIEFTNPDFEWFSSLDSMLKKSFIKTISEPIILAVEEITQDPNFYQVLYARGRILLHYAILQHSKQMFENITSKHSLEDLKMIGAQSGSLPLHYYIYSKYEHKILDTFLHGLIKESSSIFLRVQNESLLHYAVKRSAPKTTKLLLDQELDVNEQDSCGLTAMHHILKKEYNDGDYQMVAELLYHGADCTIKDDDGRTVFELLALKSTYGSSGAFPSEGELPILEILFRYTFDKHTHLELDLIVLIHMSVTNSSLFKELMNYDVKVMVSDMLFARLGYGCIRRMLIFPSLLRMEKDNLRLLQDKYGEEFKNVTPITNEIYSDIIFQTDNYYTVLNMFVESGLIYPMVHLINWRKNFDLLLNSRRSSKIEESELSKILLCLMSYGLEMSARDMELVYQSYNYCQLYKTLLNFDIVESENCQLLHKVVPTFTHKPTLDLDEFLKECKSRSSQNHTADLDLLQYFANVEAKIYVNYLLESGQIQSFEERNRLEATLMELPDVPLLVQLSRDAFRKHLVNNFNLRSPKWFYWFLNRLPLSNIHKKIITFETKLY